MRDYKPTVFLPQTDFQLRPGQFDFAAMISSLAMTGEDGFILHDGPPYANGNLHLGHALNKVLKDIAARSKGKPKFGFYHSGASFVPGWDCHGLPIELAVEKQMLAEGMSKTDIPPLSFRARCRGFAHEWIGAQRQQFKSFGVMADWSHPYLTMDNESEARIVSVLHDLVNRGLIERGTKPVQWSVVEETALAETEVEHKDIRTSQVWVRFPIAGPVFVDGAEGVMDCSVPIWTTTPWTLPANLAIAYNANLSYGLYQVIEVREGSKCIQYECFVLADARADDFSQEIGVMLDRIGDIDPSGNSFAATLDNPWHPFMREDDLDPGWSEADRWGQVPLIHGDHVTDKAGTGFVHTAPEHGPEDFVVWQANSLGEFENVVNADGSYVADMPIFGGEKVLQQTPGGEWIFEYTNAKIIAELERRGALIKTSKLVHSYAHSWRSKAPLIYRTTPQWFFRVSEIRGETLAEAERVMFIPDHSKNRFTAAIESRPDWLISRQRVWGTPLAIFVHKASGAILKNKYVERRIVETMQAEGGDAWWKHDTAYWFANTSLKPDDYEMVCDVLDVWFDSGCSLLLTKHKHADVYIEGSDQHRGWFGSSAFIHMAINGRLPFDTLITHGFVLDERNEKLSKSKKQAEKLDSIDPFSPEQICAVYSPDVLRLWIAQSDYTTDIKISEPALKTAGDMLRRFRNTFRYLLGTLNNSPRGLHHASDYPELEKYILLRTLTFNTEIELAYAKFDFKEVCRLVMDFCVNDLSAFYFDVRKDVLYCDSQFSPTRQACINTLHVIMTRLIAWLDPIIPFTVWEVVDDAIRWPFYKDSGVKPIIPESEIESQGLADVRVLSSTVDWPRVLHVIDLVNGKLAEARTAKQIGGALEAKVTVTTPDDNLFNLVDPAELFRVSQAEIVVGDELSVNVTRAEGKKCARSWKILPTVGSDPAYPDLSPRDAVAVAEYDRSHT